MKQKKQYVGWGGLAGEVVKGTKGIRPKTATDEKTMEDTGRTWSGVGFLKRIQLLFVAAPRSSAWLRCRRPPAPFPLPFPSPCHRLVFTIFYLFVVFFFRFSLFLILFFVFILLGIRKWTSLENKNHMQSAQSAKGTQTEEGKRRRRGTGVRCLRKCISFLIFFRRKIEMRFIYYVFHFWTNNDSTLSLSLSCLLAHSSHWYLHSSFSIHSASLENVSTSYICI